MRRQFAQLHLTGPCPPGARLTRAFATDLTRRWIARQSIAPWKIRAVSWIGSNARASFQGCAWGVSAINGGIVWQSGLVFADYDGPAPTFGDLARLLRIARLGRVKWTRYDRTRRGWHVIIALAARLTPAETIAIQAIIGSDTWREAMNLARIRTRRRSVSWNLLFERKLT